MKKILSLILSLTMLLTLTACGESAPAADNPAAEPEATSEQASTTEAPVVFQEVLVEDSEFCTIRITAIEPNAFWGYTLKAYLENKSTDTTYMFAVRSASINGVTADPFFATEVAAGMKANVDISFTDEALGENNIGKYSDIALNFVVYDAMDYTAEPVTTPSTHIYPLGQENAVIYSRPPQDTDTVIVDNNQATVTVTGYRTDEIWGYTADLYILNHSDAPLLFTIENASVNGYMADPFWASSVGPGNSAFQSVSWDTATLEENGIAQVEHIEFLLRAYPEDDWSAGDAVNEKIILNP